MNTQKLWETEHPYYCSGDGEDFQSWQDFIDEWDDADMDMNLLFRFDFLDKEDYLDTWDFAPDEKLLRLCYIHQRKGYTSAQTIKVQESDEPIIRAWLQTRFDYLKTLWTPLA